MHPVKHFSSDIEIAEHQLVAVFATNSLSARLLEVVISGNKEWQ